MKKKEEKKVEAVEEVKKVEEKKRGRKTLSPEEKEKAKKIKKLEEYAKDLGLTNVLISCGDNGCCYTQKITDKIKEIKKSLTDLNKLVKKI